MRNFDPKYRLGGLSLPEITRATKMAAVQYEGVVDLHGNLLQPGPMTNAVMWHWLNMPEPERTEFLRAGVERLEALMAAEESQSTPGRGREEPRRVDVEVHHRGRKKDGPKDGSDKTVGGKARG